MEHSCAGTGDKVLGLTRLRPEPQRGMLVRLVDDRREGLQVARERRGTARHWQVQRPGGPDLVLEFIGYQVAINGNRAA